MKKCFLTFAVVVVAAALTLATGEPAYYPWTIDDAPETGNGFEGAVNTITTDGSLAAITDKWLATDAGAPVLNP